MSRLPAPHPTLGAIVVSGYRLIRGFVRDHKVAFAVALLGAALFVSAIVASAIVIGWATDFVIIPVLEEGEAIDDRLALAVAVVVGVALWKAVGITLRRSGAAFLQFGASRDAKRSLIEHQLGLELSWHDQRSTGDLLSVSEVDTQAGTFVLAPMPYATGASLLLIGTVVVVGVISPILGAIVLVALGVVVGLDLYGAFSMAVAFEEAQQERGIAAEIAHESFDGALTVKALGREAEETERFAVVARSLRDKLIHLNRTWASYRSVVEAMPAATTIVVLVVGALLVPSGSISAGQLVTIAYLLSLMTIPIQLIGFVVWEMAASQAAWRRVQSVLDADELVRHGGLAAAEEGTGAAVEGDRVSFGYDPTETVLTDVHLTIEPGTTVAIVGPTGSGKSTLTKLLARLWDPGTGSIRIEGRDLRDFARSELASEVAFVAQDSFLFDDTVAGNITLGDESIAEGEVRAAARLAAVDRFVDDLPSGYATRIGERGTTLSGGQRQRIALARALVRRPRVLVLDDATSAIDPSVEAEILGGLRRADLPSTVLIVAHRRSSITLSDEVIYLEGGEVVASGTHDDLLFRVPGYSRLLEAYEEDAARRRLEQQRAST